jgi:hypothetical protein
LAAGSLLKKTEYPPDNSMLAPPLRIGMERSKDRRIVWKRKEYKKVLTNEGAL